jgi:N-acetylneuraminate synthase
MRWVADIGSNHNGELSRATELIQKARAIGCTDVKFQMFNRLIGKPEREWLNPGWLPALRDWAHDYRLGFGCSPFYLEAVKLLEPYVDFYKIASSMMGRDDILKACVKTGKPVVMSFGIGGEFQLRHAEEILWDSSSEGKNLTILHCICNYPAPIEKCNLKKITEFGLDGWSDHSHSPAVIYRAVHHYNAQMVEFHLDLDGKGWEYHYGHCWLPDEIATVIKTVNEGFEAD